VPARLGRPARRPAQGKPARGWPENGARQRRRPGPGISAVCLHLRCLLFLLQSPRSRAAASPGEQQQGHHTGLAVDAGEKPGEKPAEMETGVHKVLDPLVAGHGSHGGRGGRDILSPARLRVFPRHHLVAGVAPCVGVNSGSPPL
jgi:hypothetical protein